MPNNRSAWSFNTDRCKRCRLCVSLCPAAALAADEDGAPRQVGGENCRRCGLCAAWCPDFAIDVGGGIGAR